MTRQKKSRKSAPLAPTQKPRQKKTDMAESVGKRIKKHKGLASGSRNNPETKNSNAANQPGKSTDPRHGSKKPIDLKPVAPVKIPDLEPQYAEKKSLKKVQPSAMTPEEELQMIENDERLAALLERKDNDELLTGKDAKYFNAKTARHQVLMEELGYEYDDDEDDDESFSSVSLVDQWENDDSDEEDEGKSHK